MISSNGEHGFCIKPPDSYRELVSRLEAINGKYIAELAEAAAMRLPSSPLHGKGFTGELLERLLGATGRSRPIPDFPSLKLELKTLPVDKNLKPLESTFFSYAPLVNVRGISFEQSALFSKMQRVLFVTVCAQRDMNFHERFISGFFFWSPDDRQLELIRQDYEELMEMVRTGNINLITARMGSVIQMRPKAADGKALTNCVGPDGGIVKTRPRGFYMRRSFTQQLIKTYLAPK